ncbi:MAG: phosphatidylglycerol lysyltransferase domain-containing protein [Planctomycetota bacterium]
MTDYTFASTYMWGGSLALYWSVIDRHLCVFANGTGDLTMLMPPMPFGDVRDGDGRNCLANCFEIMDEYNDRVSDRSHSRIEYISEEFLASVQSSSPFGVHVTSMSGDYIYEMQRMVDLAGGNLKSKRHARSKFMREYPDHRTEALGAEHVDSCMELLERWCRHGDACHLGEVNDSNVATDILRHRDFHATKRALQTYRDLGLTGMVLYVGETLVGFTLGEAISDSQASILIEKTHPDYHGSAQFIFSEFCRQYWSHLQECNVGDDWGIPSLQFTKESYRPIRMLAKHVLQRETVTMVGGFDLEPAAVAGRIEAISEAESTSSSDSSRAFDLSFRPARMEDVSAILALEQRCFDSAAETFNRRQVRNLITSPARRCIDC